MTFPGWDLRLLGALGIAATPARLTFLHAWASCEGGTARNNPLNTTMPLAGATAYNSAGVRHYPDPIAGTAATLLTLRLPFYRALLQALTLPGLTALQIAERSATPLQTWGTGSRCIVARLRSHV